ncbi:MAG: MarR family transcriptional regulator [Chloroflexota bacterium]
MEKAELIGEIIELQQKVDQGRRQYEPDVWIGLNVTIAQLRSLFFITHQGSTSLSKLAAALEVTPTNVTGIVDRLVKKGLVTRTESDQDRRVLLLRATKEGEKLVARLRERRIGYMSEALAHMSMEELATLAHGFTSLVMAVQAYEDKGKDEHDESRKLDQAVQSLHSSR